MVSFYHDFRTTPPAQHTIALCRAEACQSVGAQALYDETKSRATSGALHDSVEVNEVFCLGNCALGPAGMIDGRLYGALDACSHQRDHDRLEQCVSTNMLVYVPADAAATSVGADEVAIALSAIPDVSVIRTGSRGMLWAEPLVEVLTESGRTGYANVTATEAAAVATQGWEALSHRAIGLVEDHPWLANQQRVTCARVGIVDPVVDCRLRRARRLGGLASGSRDDAVRGGRGGHRVGCARPGRRRIPSRHQVEDGPRTGRRPQVRLLQLRRGRLRERSPTGWSWREIPSRSSRA